MSLDGSGGDEQGLGDRAVGEPFGGQFGDAAFAGGERFEPGEQYAAGPGAGSAQFGLGAPGERRGAEVVGGVEGLAE